MSALLVGGLGLPHDALVAATLRAGGVPAEPLGAMDAEAYERGRAALPRGQCAPMLYTTGALLRAARGRSGLRALNVQSCGPCRFALFGAGWAHALERAGLPPVELVSMEPSLAAVLGAPAAPRAFAPPAPLALLEAVAAADALAETAHRLRPYERAPGAVDEAARAATTETCARIERGEAPLDALSAVRGWSDGLWEVGPAPLARAVLVGEPWSVHVDGDGRLQLPRVLAAAGVELEIPLLGTWLAYLAWQGRRPGFGRRSALDLARVAALEARLAATYAAAADAAGLDDFALPDMDAVERAAAPHVSPAIRGGYGHVEVGLALLAAAARRAHFVISIKSFGCIPSAGITDAILPTALDGVPYLSIELSSDGEAARESRLAMRVADALDRASEELSAARVGGRPARLDPLRPPRGPRRFACTLAELAALG